MHDPHEASIQKVGCYSLSSNPTDVKVSKLYAHTYFIFSLVYRGDIRT